uniref:Switch-associated protein 70 n=1 Tax=Lynx canadensis TaxID=61383 RepID=A0A667GLQ6_LYNCA
MGGLKDELLKAIWHAFTALDLDHSGKVSKSQLKVLSHNLCTVLNVPHDPVALEEHFRDDDEGPVSNQGYMPYLNKFILEKVQDNFDKIEFNRMCWTLCVKKNLTKSPLLITEEDAFKVWVIFNFLSEDKYPLIIVPEEIEYLLKKLTEAMGGGWQQEQFEHYKINFDDSKDGLSVWELIELIGNGQFSKGMDRQTVSMAINEVFNELILDVLKQGYMMKKGHRRKNWTERWFVLKPNIISYYVGEDLKDKKGDILLDENCCVEVKMPFSHKCFDKTFEISASDKKKKQEWIQAIHSTIHLLKLGSPPPHKEEELERQMKEKVGMEAASRAAEEEKKRLQTQVELQARFSTELEREKLIRQQMEEQVAQKSSELEQYLQRVQELEDMYLKLQEALEDERQARQDEETVRKLQARLLEEESSKRAELEKWHLEQQQAIQTTEAEKQELENQRVLKERALQEAREQLEQLELERKQALEQYEGVKKKLEMATSKTKSWKDKVAQHEGLIRLIEPGSKNPHLITNWGPAAFTQAELEEREKNWKGKKNTE